MDMKQLKLLYVYDPMCSWCWGYSKTWAVLQHEIKDLIEVKYYVGGLAPDSNDIMPLQMQTMLQQTWLNITAELGCEFNFDFWTKCTPKRSTYWACRAILVAREYDLEQKMLYSIQQAYYLQAKNPSDISVLVDIAGELGLNEKTFLEKLYCESTNRQLEQEVSFARMLPIQGFPSLVLAVKGQYIPIKLDYKNWQKTFDDINTIIHTGA
jgi:putative protein-disulfide isomerase